MSLNLALRLGAVAASAGAPTLTHSYVTSAENTANLSTYTFSSQSLGTAASDRRIVIVAATRGTSSTSTATVTVAGISATVDYFDGFTGTGNSVLFASAEVPTGTTGDVVIAYGGVTQLRCIMAVYRIVGGALSVDDTAIAREFSTTPTNLALSPTTSGGVAIGVCANADATATCSWTNLTEDAEAAGGEAFTASFASAALAGSSLTVTATESNSASNVAAAIAYKGV